MESTCAAHNKPAVSRCKLCLKPLCEQCELKADEGTFCGTECLGKYQQAQPQWNEMKKKQEESNKIERARRIRSTILSLFIYAVIIAVVIFIWESLPLSLKHKIVEDFRGLLKGPKMIQ